MNERLKQLAEQAGITTNIDTNYFEKDMNKWVDYFSEKFAELIVAECTKAVMDGTKEGDHYAMRIENHFDNGTGGILHFGVEEK